MQGVQIMKVIASYAYSEKDKIGQGFSSQVYKGISLRNQQPVAIKVINNLQINTPISRTLLKNEMQVLTQLDSPNLLKVYDIHQTQNNTYIITEFCEQGDLADLIHSKPVNEKLATRILIQILSGMKALQKKSIIHRDIKPANILISQGVYKLADFGFAVSEITPLNKSILQNFSVGTPLYMAPETVIYNTYSEKSDIWALGIVLYEMLCGSQPFKAQNDQNLAQIYLQKPIQFPCGTNISLNMKKLILNMLQVDSNRRFGIDQTLNQIYTTLIEQEPQAFKPNYTQDSPQQIRRSIRKRDTSPAIIYAKQEEKEVYQSANVLPTYHALPPRPQIGVQISVPIQVFESNNKQLPRSKTPQQRRSQYGTSFLQYEQVRTPSQQRQPLYFKKNPKEIDIQCRKQSLEKPAAQDTYEYRISSKQKNNIPLDIPRSSQRLPKAIPVVPLTMRYSERGENSYKSNRDFYHDQITTLNNQQQELKLAQYQSENNLLDKNNDKLNVEYESGRPSDEPIISDFIQPKLTPYQEQSISKSTSSVDDKTSIQSIKKNKIEIDRKIQVLFEMCKFFEKGISSLDAFLVSSTLSTPSSSAMKCLTLLAIKCQFLFMKCIGIKCNQIKQYLNEYATKQIQSFNETYTRLELSKDSLSAGDRRFVALFDNSLEDDCSGFYAILTYFIKEFAKNILINQSEIDVLLLERLLKMHEVIKVHLNYFNDDDAFAEEYLKTIEEYNNDIIPFKKSQIVAITKEKLEI